MTLVKVILKTMCVSVMAERQASSANVKVHTCKAAIVKKNQSTPHRLENDKLHLGSANPEETGYGFGEGEDFGVQDQAANQAAGFQLENVHEFVDDMVEGENGFGEEQFAYDCVEAFFNTTTIEDLIDLKDENKEDGKFTPMWKNIYSCEKWEQPRTCEGLSDILIAMDAWLHTHGMGMKPGLFDEDTVDAELLEESLQEEAQGGCDGKMESAEAFVAFIKSWWPTAEIKEDE
eukprot:gnl/MRDRNA2_/MRDRNA2_101868_c0_seq1.p1 gnl/MRDRNA2_/MRDRNA2_101868_c0~~gnl/MRDRNA2_/MRDRNA2_101868_c0_seq1.p1  ORF type:complete len:233 (+),score=66.49 gnl/MRDRNA2_/MRDRNA2_101868_c0_seq1:100-798(+)